MRKLLWIIGIPVVIVLLAVIIVPMVLDEEALVRIASEQIEDQTGGQLAVNGEASISIFPKASLSMTEVTYSMPEEGTEIDAGSLHIGVALMPLLSRTVAIESIAIQDLVLTTVAADEEVARAAEIDTSTMTEAELDAFYALRDEARIKAGAQAAASAIVAPLALEVADLSLKDIRVLTVDDSGDVISELQLRYFTTSDVNLEGRPSPLSAHIVLADDEAPIDIVLNGSITTNLDEERVALEGLEVKVTGATPDPITLAASGNVALDTQIADLSLSLATGSLEGQGSVRYASFESPQIDATLALTELNPALLVLAGPDAAEAMPEETDESSGDGSLPLHALRMMDTRAKLTIDQVILDAHTLENVTAELRVVDGVATLDPVKATLHGGAISFSAVLNGHYNTARLATEGDVSGLDVKQTIAALDAGMAAHGTANLGWSLKGQGRTSADLTESLNGPISFTTKDITLEGIALEQMVCRGVALVNQEALSAEFPADTSFQALEAQIQLTDGVARLNPLTAQLASLGLKGNGNFNLTSGDLRASFRAQLNPALGEFDPACRINERYADVRWPVECKGNLEDDPAGWCNMNTSEIIKDLAEGELKRKAEEEAGRFLKKLFD